MRSGRSNHRQTAILEANRLKGRCLGLMEGVATPMWRMRPRGGSDLHKNKSIAACIMNGLNLATRLSCRPAFERRSTVLKAIGEPLSPLISARRGWSIVAEA